MDGKNNIETLLDLLAKLGVCRTGRRWLNGTEKDFDTLVKVWQGWPEFLCEHSAEACRLLREHLTDEDKARLADRYLFFDIARTVTIERFGKPVFVVGGSDVRLTLPDFAFVKLYVFDNAVVTCELGSHAVLNLEAYNEASVTVRNSGVDCSATAYRYDNAAVYGDVDRLVSKEYKRGEVFNGKEIRR